MDLVILIKVLLLGIIWVGSFYFVAALLLHYFPMPLLLLIRKGLQEFCDEIAKHNEKRGRRLWQSSKLLLKLLAAALWGSLIYFCASFFVEILPSFVPKNNPLFWAYYVIALGIPLITILALGIYIFWNARRKDRIAVETPTETDNRPLFERMF